MAKKINPIKVQEALVSRNIFIFSPLEFERIFNVSRNAASFFISSNVKKGFFVKLKNNLYALKIRFPSELIIANKIYSPSYVSLEYALMYYNIIPDTVYSITSVSSKPTREFTIKNVLYVYSKIKKQAFTGYVKKEIDGNIALIAEPEKAFVDYLYFVDLGKKPIYDRINVRELSKDKIMKYAKLFKRESLIKLVKKIYDESRRAKEIIY